MSDALTTSSPLPVIDPLGWSPVIDLLGIGPFIDPLAAGPTDR